MFVPTEFLVAFLGLFGLWSVTTLGILVQSWRKLNEALVNIKDRLIVVETVVQYYHPPSVPNPPVQPPTIQKGQNNA